ncbi:MAG: 1-(5-phosphoribosyl)-5-((5-phosphoribosylamino)methylideneamino)imidazole-4-carboxamide isomerase, partial [Clostridia bacterium]|nr:1-(5-phosphoribosyl)-5-((5-phosphoribosylamino)methylideneamino)imidazole-4-carboxamide isomerase [Clostridia bacterium]
MQLYPAIDLYDKKAVRLFKGDYSKMTVYSNDPLSVALDFESKGAKYIHLVDLEGAKDGTTPNLEVVKSIAQNTNLFVEIGGGIRDMQRIDEYLSGGVNRVILGTAA